MTSWQEIRRRFEGIPIRVEGTQPRDVLTLMKEARERMGQMPRMGAFYMSPEGYATAYRVVSADAYWRGMP